MAGVVTMPRPDLMNLHVPLPRSLHQRLRAEAKRTHRPATALAREAIDHWLAEKYRASLHQALSTYAQEVAGTAADLDGALEGAGVKHLLESEKVPGQDADR